MSLRSLAKKFIDYTIEDDDKVYRLKKTPFAYRKNFTADFRRQYRDLPICENKVVFDNYMGSGYGCNGKYVTEYLLGEEAEFAEKLDIVWITKDAEKRREMFPPQVRLVEYGSPEAMREYATSRIWIKNFQMIHYLNKGLVKREGQTYVQMWHGSFGIKKIESGVAYLQKDRPWLALAKKNAAYTDYWISNSAFETQVYKDAFWGAGEILEYGHPRNDLFFKDTTEIAQKVRRKYGIGEEEKIFLYVPTFRDKNRLQVIMPDRDKISESMTKRFGGTWVFALRNHPRYAVNEKLCAKEREEGCHTPLIDVTDYADMQELLVAADAVLTDYSSAIFDFVLTGRPGFMLVEDYDAYKDLRGLYYPPEETPFAVAYSEEELLAQIEQFDEEVYRKKAEDFLAEKGSVEDGKAAGRVAGLIKEIIEKG